MFVRVLFLLLLALNLGAIGWIVSMPRETPALAPVTDPGVQELVLLSERDKIGAAGAEPPVAPVPAAPDPGNDLCKSIGPFQTQSDLRAAMSALTPLTRRIQFRETKVTQSRGYWVYLSAFATREQALAAARQLSAKGVRDYYVVTAGDQQNTVSLGLFREQANAQRRYAEVTSLGIPAQLTERSEETPQYWIDFAEGRTTPINWRAQFRGAPGITESAAECF